MQVKSAKADVKASLFWACAYDLFATALRAPQRNAPQALCALNRLSLTDVYGQIVSSINPAQLLPFRTDLSVFEPSLGHRNLDIGKWPAEACSRKTPA